MIAVTRVGRSTAGKQAALAVLSLAWVFALYSRASAQSDFYLRYCELSDTSHPCALAAKQYLGRPADNPGTWVAYVADKTVAVGLVGSACYVDTDGDGVLTDEDPLPQRGSRREGSVFIYQFGPVAIPVQDARGQATVPMWVEVTSTGQGSPYLSVCPAAYVSGEALLGGRRHQVSVVDGNYDGRYDSIFSGTGRPADWLAVDLNGDGRISPHTDPSGELMPLPRMLRAAGAYYSLQVLPDGSAMRLLPAEPALGVLDVGSPYLQLVLWSDTGTYCLTSGAPRWELPQGIYAATSYRLSATDARHEQWVLSGSGGAGQLAAFNIVAGQTTRISAGLPLILKTDANDAGPRAISIGCAVTGQAGEEYSPGALRNGQRVPPPQFRIVDEYGRVGVQGSFEYG